MDTSLSSTTPDNDAEVLDDASIDRRQALRRLAVGGAIVWSAPLISRTAFAASATSCSNFTLDWNTLGTPGTSFTNATVGGVTISLNAPSMFGGSTNINNDRKIIAAPIGGINTQGVQFEQTPRYSAGPPENPGGQLITFTFSQSVYNVSFSICDIDTLGGNWSDRVIIVSPTNYTYSMPAGSGVIGDGTATGTTTTTGPFRNSNNNNNYPNSSNAGNVTVTFPGPLTTFSMKFQCSTIQGGGNQLIKVTPIAFCA